ncbi:DUF6624 domain-containing protein [Luteimonas huabeiensis]|uniref:DUF6624 domain-containing protein n=1 Tax=Luteimonas huabeiensis TaxID=1244513 RepID=UPI0004634791|nr:DUF6624 domain-containing protein [Luteimonas huabeiensis]
MRDAAEDPVRRIAPASGARRCARRVALVVALAIALPAHADTPPALLDAVPADRPVDLAALDWIAPRFSEDPAERARWDALLDWANATREARTAAMRAAFRERGVEATALPVACYADTRCGLVRSAEAAAAQFGSWPAFAAAAAAAAPYVLGIRRATEIVDSIHAVRPPTDPDAATARDLQRRFINDQLLRNALDGLPGRPDVPPDDPVYVLYEFALGTDFSREDLRNVVHASALIAERGWPAPQETGADTQQHLWALVQHGDLRPDLQYDALQAMQRRFAAPPYPQEYGYLHDRVMLKVAGTQRYGTQVTCDGDARVAQPLDGSGAIDTLRAEVGLGPLADYLAKFPPCALRP